MRPTASGPPGRERVPPDPAARAAAGVLAVLLVAAGAWALPARRPGASPVPDAAGAQAPRRDQGLPDRAAPAPLSVRAAPMPAIEAASPRGAVAADPLLVPFPDTIALARAAAGAAATPAAPVAGARIAVVPHHWPAGHLLLAALRDARPPPGGWRRAVVLGPDHARRGAGSAATSARGWRGASGLVRADAAGVAALVRRGVARDDALIAAEHGVSGVLPAVGWAMQDAAVVPVAVRGDASSAAAERLAAALAPWVDGSTLVVLSVDLSHGLAPADAARHDAETLAAFAALAPERMRGWSDEHLDARGAARTAIALARRLGATRFVLRERTDGSRLPDYDGGPVTGYAAGYFVRP